VTPLQLAHYVGIIATEGVNAVPHIILKDCEPPERVDGISAHSFQIVKKGMLRVVNAPQGTAKTAQVPGHLVAGKTGTAQNPHGYAHKIFVGFAPYKAPSITLAVVAENTDYIKPSLAVTIARQVLTEYFNCYPDTTGTELGE
jgi:cell division protein FtsI/penicillin-binding protein 2